MVRKLFKQKEGTLGIEESKYKARLVMKGYSWVFFGIMVIHDFGVWRLPYFFAWCTRGRYLHATTIEFYSLRKGGLGFALLKTLFYGLKQSPIV